jgi:DNA mismatch repair protein MutS
MGSKTASGAETPLMKQYNEIKSKYPDALLLFRVGDFYETFGEDAVKTAGILGIVLTRRANGAAAFIELAGFPHHALDTYLPKLVRAGHRVAICDQLEDPKLTKTIVKRGVTELITPGVAINDKILENHTNNFLACIYFEKDHAGIAFLDVSTAEFYAAEGSLQYAEKLIQNFRPSEVLVAKPQRKLFNELVGEKLFSFMLDDWIFSSDYSREILLRQFKTVSLKGFGIENLKLATIAAGACLHYASEARNHQMAHVGSISRIEEDRYVWLDKFTIRNLELFQSSGDDGKALIDVLDATSSAMGSRMLKRWLALPLKDAAPIEERHQVVEFLIEHPDFAQQLLQQLKVIGDMERLISKVAVARINPREMLQLRDALFAVKEIKSICSQAGIEPLLKMAEQLNACESIAQRIMNEIQENPAVLIQKGGVMAAGVNRELDELRLISHSGKDYLLQLQQMEAERTGISSLKVSFNNVFGYYLEVTHTHKDKVPAHWVRRQTLTNAERYITPELKEYEEKIMGAEEKILALETTLYNNLVLAVMDYIQPVQLNASIIARLDCLLSFASISIRNNYVKPLINEGFDIDIKLGRHPVIEKLLPSGESYIANDIRLDTEHCQVMMITGPNMSGKSALLRQTALILLMAQIGCFVPAAEANLGLVDKIFTRVGASDNISSGESTFMVEMNETASILNNLSARSLILLDEIGRGTSTYDGISIAWSIAEFIHQHPTKAKTMFATHYHELNDMAEKFPRIRNYNVSVKELDNRVLFLRKLSEGGSNHSFGIHVAQMAGMPAQVVRKAKEILDHLETIHRSDEKIKTPAKPDYQLSFFQLEDPVLQQIKDELTQIDLNTLTPIEAMLKLQEIKKIVGG